jgi:hypothetical protein
MLMFCTRNTSTFVVSSKASTYPIASEPLQRSGDCRQRRNRLSCLRFPVGVCPANGHRCVVLFDSNEACFQAPFPEFGTHPFHLNATKLDWRGSRMDSKMNASKGRAAVLCGRNVVHSSCRLCVGQLDTIVSPASRAINPGNDIRGPRSGKDHGNVTLRVFVWV